MPAQSRLFAILLLSLTCSVASSSYAQASPDTRSNPEAINNHEITGVWRSIDDKTGYPKALIRIEKTANNSYSGTVQSFIPRPNYTPEKTCIDCPAPFTDKPIIGMTILWGLTVDAADANGYENGKILDPLSGHIYRAQLHLSPDGKTLNVRGYIGFSLFGRSQVWLRD